MLNPTTELQKLISDMVVNHLPLDRKIIISFMNMPQDARHAILANMAGLKYAAQTNSDSLNILVNIHALLKALDKMIQNPAAEPDVRIREEKVNELLALINEYSRDIRIPISSIRVDFSLIDSTGRQYVLSKIRAMVIDIEGEVAYIPKSRLLDLYVVLVDVHSVLDRESTSNESDDDEDSDIELSDDDDDDDDYGPFCMDEIVRELANDLDKNLRNHHLKNAIITSAISQIDWMIFAMSNPDNFNKPSDRNSVASEIARIFNQCGVIPEHVQEIKRAIQTKHDEFCEQCRRDQFLNARFKKRKLAVFDTVLEILYEMCHIKHITK